MRPLGSAEAQLIRELVLSGRPDGPQPRLATAIDWDALLQAARRHRLGTLVLEGIQRAALQAPRSVTERLANDRSRELARAVLQFHHLDELAACAAQSGRRVALLKGSALRTTLYADPSSRPMGDVDVLVDTHEFNGWCDTLESLGYTSRDTSDHATLFEKEGRGVYVELHRTLTSCADYLELDTTEFMARSVPAQGYDDSAVRTLCLEDHLLHLCLHSSFQHGMRQAAINAWDAHVVAGRAELEMSGFLSRASHPRRRAFVYGGLCLAATLFPNDRLRQALEALEPSLPGHLVRRAGALRPGRLLATSPRAVFGSPVARLAWVERPADGIRVLLEILRPRAGLGLSAYCARASQLLRNHIVTPILAKSARHLPARPRSSRASLQEVGDV